MSKLSNDTKLYTLEAGEFLLERSVKAFLKLGRIVLCLQPAPFFVLDAANGTLQNDFPHFWQNVPTPQFVYFSIQTVPKWPWIFHMLCTFRRLEQPFIVWLEESCILGLSLDISGHSKTVWPANNKTIFGNTKMSAQVLSAAFPVCAPRTFAIQIYVEKVGKYVFPLFLNFTHFPFPPLHVAKSSL